MSFDVVAFIFLGLAVELGLLTRPPSREEVRERRSHSCLPGWTLSAEASGSTPPRGYSDEQLLVSWFAARAGSRGSDVRLTTGEQTRPSKVRYQGVDPRLWRWKIAAAFQWKRSGHINELEARAGLADLKRRTRRVRSHGKRYLHLFDSQATLGIMTKKRSSARILHFVARRAAALELAASIHPIYAFTRSGENPADAPSRLAESSMRPLLRRRRCRKVPRKRYG